KVSVDAKRPSPLIGPVADRGKNASTTAAISGNQRTVESKGINFLRSSENPYEHHHAEEEHQRVIAHVAGLEESKEIAESFDDVAEHRRDAVDDRVDDAPQEHGHPFEWPDDDRGVDLVDVVLVVERVREARRALLDGHVG